MKQIFVLPRFALFCVLSIILMFGCSKGGGNPVVPSSPTDESMHNIQSSGEIQKVTPALTWILKEPADIFDEPVDDAYTGDPDNPTREYTDDYAGPVFLKVTDNYQGECETSVAVIVEIT